MAKAALSTLLIALLGSSEAWAAPPPLTYDDASQSQTRDERDSRVVYSVVKHFVEERRGLLVNWGGSEPGKTSNHDRIMIIAMQTAWIASSLYMLKYPQLFAPLDTPGQPSLHSELLDKFVFNPNAPSTTSCIGSPNYDQCRTQNARDYFNQYFGHSKIMLGVGSSEDYDMALTGLVSLLYVFQNDTTSLTNETVYRILKPDQDSRCDNSDCHDYLGSGGLLLFRIPDFLTYRWEELVPDAGPLDDWLQILFDTLTDPLMELIKLLTGYDLRIVHETENHVMMIHAWNILATNWVLWQGRLNSNNSRYDWRITQWYNQYANQVYDKLNEKSADYFYMNILRYLGRIVHSGYFETNSRPYHRHILQPILALAQFGHILGADDAVAPHQDRVKTAAINALNYTAAKFTFQALRSKRNAPFRRKETYKKNISFYSNGSAHMFGVLSGAVEYDDCTDPLDKCKVRNPTNAGGPYQELWAALGRLHARYTGNPQYVYELPPPIHGQMFDRGPYYARIQARYGKKNYELVGKRPLYFATEQDAAVAGRFLGSPETHFGTDDVIIGGGGSFVSYGAHVEYNFRTRPTMLYGLGDFGHGMSSGNVSSRPFGTWLEGDLLDLDTPAENVLMLIGNREGDAYWLSPCNNLVYKNFVYGYERVRTPSAPDYHDGWPQRYPADWDVFNLEVPSFYVQDAEFKIFSFFQGGLGSNDVDPDTNLPRNRTKPYFIIMGRMQKDTASAPDSERFHWYRRGTVEVIPMDSGRWSSAADLRDEFLDWNKPVFNYFSGDDAATPYKYVLTMSKERLTLSSVIGSNDAGDLKCYSGIDKIEQSLFNQPGGSGGDLGWVQRDLKEYMFPSNQDDSDNRKDLPLISVWELNSEYGYTGRMLVEVKHHDQADIAHPAGTIQHGHIVVRRPIKKTVVYQVGDGQTLEYEYDAWQCLDINSHDLRYPTTAYAESTSYEDCFSPEVNLPPVAAISAGAMHSCATLADGTAWCWGDDFYGQLGNGSGLFGYPTPTQVMFQLIPEPGVWEVRPFDLAKTISAGGQHTCALQTGNAAWCWGDNEHGQLGNPDYVQAQSPVTVYAPNTAEPTAMTFQAISAGGSHTCGITPHSAIDGQGDRLYCWGNNDHGQLGDGTTMVDRFEPTEVLLSGPVQAVSAGSRHTCAITDDGVGWCWGDNGSGQLGNGTEIDSPTPVMVEATSGPSTPVMESLRSISTGAYHTCAVDEGLTTWCWGNNAHGQLGDSSGTSRSAAVRVLGLVGRKVQAVSAGANHTCAFVCEGGEGNPCDGHIWCWGVNYAGQLGDGSTADSATPVVVLYLSNLVGFDAGNSHNCAITSVGEMYCWGANGSGQIGDNTILDRLFPSAVVWP